MMRLRQDRAEQLYINCLDLGCGFRHEGDRVVVLVPSKHNQKGQEHPVLQKVLDRYQDVLVALVPPHGVRPDDWRPATTEAITPHNDTEKLSLITGSVDNARKNEEKKKACRRAQVKKKKVGVKQWVNPYPEMDLSR